METPASQEHASELEALRAEVEHLREWYRESHEIVQAIHGGEVDAVVVKPSEQEHAVYTFFGADHPYRMLVEAMREGAVTLAKDGTVLYCNPSFARMMRARSSSIVGASFARFVPPAEASRFQAFLAQAGDDKAEMTLVSEDGANVPVYLSRSAADLVGVRGICLVVTDLTEQKKHEEVVASERLARSILEQAAEAIVVCDEAGRITHSSRQAAVLCRQNPLLRRFDEVFHLELAPDHPAGGARPGPLTKAEQRAFFVELACGKRSVVGREVTCAGDEDEVLHLLLSSSPLQGEHGQVLGAVIILADITVGKRAAAALLESERKLRVLNETLEQRVAERTRELSQANHVLGQKNRELQDFAYVASHDLQEPLRKITTFLDLLLEEFGDRLPEDGQFYAERIKAAAHRMSGLLRSLLDYSRIATHGSPLQPVDLNAVLAEVLSDLDMSISELEAEVITEDLPTMVADPLQMRQLFAHLVGNALKFHRPNVPPVIRIRAGFEKRDGAATSDGAASAVRLEVEDNGIGFDEKYVGRIFSPFQRLHGRAQYPGAGMGLAICRRIVERHYGAITAHSAPGQGATFVVTLPLLSATAEAHPHGTA